MTREELQPGDYVAGRYVILEEIGRGGFGIVYRAIQEGVNRQVALKTVRRLAQDIQHFNLTDAFRQEALHTSRLKHPNSITLFDFGETEDGLLFLVTEFLEGETLYERMWRLKTISPEVTIHIAKQIAKALGEAHGLGIIHGDLKPANIFLCHVPGEEDFVKVLDFGIAKAIGEVDPAGLGTPEYMPPEQFLGKPLLAASDIYSLGVILYEMLAGQRPFTDKDTRKLAEQHMHHALPPLPAGLDDAPLGQILQRCMAKTDADRYLNGAELFRALDEIGKAPRPGPRVTGIAPARLSGSAPARASGIIGARFEEGGRPSASFSGVRHAALPWRSRSDDGPALMSSIIGRDEERQAWLQRVSALGEGEPGGIILLGGAVGVGKSHLMRWLMQEAQIHELVLRGQGAWRETPPTPLEAVADALADALGHARGLALQHDPRKLELALREHLGRALREDERAALRALLSPTPEASAPNEVAKLLLGLSQAQPLVLHLDDLHWSTPQGLAFLEALAERLARAPSALLLVGALRREALPASAETVERLVGLARRRGEVVKAEALGPMPADDLRLIAREFLQRRASAALRGDPSPALLDAVVARSCGNPLYARQLLDHLLQSNLLVAGPEGLALGEGVSLEEHAPAWMSEFMRLRVEQLHQRHRNGKELEYMALCAALLGPRSPKGLLAHMLRLEAETGYERAKTVLQGFEAHLGELAQEDLLVVRGDEVSFAQPLLRQWLERKAARLPTFAQWQRRAALAKHAWWSAQGALDEHCAEIGEHYDQAGEATEALRFLRAAAQDRLGVGDARGAAQSLERCRTLVARHPRLSKVQGRLLMALAWLKGGAGAFSEAEALLAQAQAFFEERLDEAGLRDLSLLGAYLRLGAGQLDEPLAALEDAQARYEAAAQREYLEQEPEDLAQRVLSLEPCSARFGAACAHWLKALALAPQRQLARAQQDLKRAWQGFLALKNPWGMAQVLLAAASWQRGAAEGRALQARAAQLLGPKPPWPSRLQLGLLEADHKRLSGQAPQAEALLQALLEQLRAVGDPPEVASVHRALAQCLAQRGRAEEAQEHFLRATALSRARGSRLVLLDSLVDHGRFLLAQRRRPQALQAHHEALKLARQLRAFSRLPQLQLLQGELEEAAERHDQALEWFSRARDGAEPSGQPLQTLQAHALMARLVRHRAAPLHAKAARVHYDAAQVGSKELGLVLEEVCQATEALALSYQRAHQGAAAQQLWRQAEAAWEQLGNAAESRRLREQAHGEL